ncbi:zinc finger, CCHC-type containing protein [Tanacetum coccineum]
MEEEKSVENNEVVGKNIIEPNKSNVAETLEEVDRDDEVENRTNNELVRSAEKDLTREKVRELVKTPRHNLGKMECESYHSLLVEPMRKAMLKKMITKKEDMGVTLVTDEKLIETDIRLSLASQSYIYPLGIAKHVLVEIASFIYHVDFVILDIKEDRKRPFILGTPFLTTAKAKIMFNKGTITLKSGKSKTNIFKTPEYFCKFKEREKDEIDPITPISIVSKQILEWEERIKFHHEKELEFNQWRGKMFTDKNSATTREDVIFKDEGGVTLYLMIRSFGVLRSFIGRDDDLASYHIYWDGGRVLHNEIRATSQGRMRSYITYAMTLLEIFPNPLRCFQDYAWNDHGVFGVAFLVDEIISFCEIDLLHFLSSTSASDIYIDENLVENLLII